MRSAARRAAGGRLPPAARVRHGARPGRATGGLLRLHVALVHRPQLAARGGRPARPAEPDRQHPDPARCRRAGSLGVGDLPRAGRDLPAARRLERLSGLEHAPAATARRGPSGRCAQAPQVLGVRRLRGRHPAAGLLPRFDRAPGRPERPHRPLSNRSTTSLSRPRSVRVTRPRPRRLHGRRSTAARRRRTSRPASATKGRSRPPRRCRSTSTG